MRCHLNDDLIPCDNQSQHANNIHNQQSIPIRSYQYVSHFFVSVVFLRFGLDCDAKVLIANDNSIKTNSTPDESVRIGFGMTGCEKQTTTTTTKLFSDIQRKSRCDIAKNTVNKLRVSWAVTLYEPNADWRNSRIYAALHFLFGFNANQFTFSLISRSLATFALFLFGSFVRVLRVAALFFSVFVCSHRKIVLRRACCDTYDVNRTSPSYNNNNDNDDIEERVRCSN